MKRHYFQLIVIGLLLVPACASPATLVEPGETDALPTAAPIQAPTTLPPAAAFDKWSLWTGERGTQLRGANTWQRIVAPDLDGDEFLGNGYIGPPYVQEDFNELAALGANYVNLSHPGLFTERPPYVLDEQVQANLDGLIEMAAQALANLFRATFCPYLGKRTVQYCCFSKNLIEHWGIVKQLPRYLFIDMRPEPVIHGLRSAANQCAVPHRLRCGVSLAAKSA